MAKYTSDLDEEPAIVTCNGQPLVAALVVLEDADLESISLSTTPQFMEMILRSRARRRSEGGISSTEVRHRLNTVRLTNS